MSNSNIPRYENYIESNFLTLDGLKQLLDEDSSWVNPVDFLQESPMVLLLRNKNCSADMVKLLLQYTSNINYRNSSGNTFLSVALKQEKDEAIIKVFLENGANMNILDGRERSALCVAIDRCASNKVIKLMLDAKCQSHNCGRHGPLIHCALEGPWGLTEDLLELLMTAGEDLNSVDADGRSALCIAFRNAEHIGLLLSKGASLNACKMHESPMLCATDVMRRLNLKTAVVRLLLNKKAAMDKKSAGCTPLQCALFRTRYEVNAIKLMVDHSSFDVNASHEVYGNLLSIAVRNPGCDVRVVRLLLERGVQVEEISPDGQTLMEIAFKKSLDCQVLKLLIASGASINVLMNHNHISILQFPFNTIDSLLQFPSYYTNSLLQFALYRLNYDPCLKNRDCFKLLLQCSCLENLDFRIQDLRLNQSEQSQSLEFIDNCRNELQLMELQTLSRNHTLRDFASRRYFPQDHTNDCNSTMISNDLNELLRVLSDNLFPIYFDFIVTKIGRVSMEAKLEEVPVYTINYTISSCTEKCIKLNYDSVLNIIQYLNDEDLMKLILAFFCSSR